MTKIDEIVKRRSTIEKENEFALFIENFSKDKYTFFSKAFIQRRLGMSSSTVTRRLSGLSERGLIRVYQISGTDKMLLIPRSNFHNIENILKETRFGHRYALKYSSNNFRTQLIFSDSRKKDAENDVVYDEGRASASVVYSTLNIYSYKESSNRGGVGERTPKQQSLPLHKVNILEEKQQATSHEELNKLHDNDPVSLYEQVCKMSMSPQEMAVLTERFGREEVRNRYKRAMKSIARCRIDHPKKGYSLKTPRELTEEWCLEEMEKKQRVMRSKEEKANEVKNKQRARVKEIIEKINETSDWGHEAIQMDNSSIELVKIMPTSRGGYEGHHKTPVLYEDPELMDKLFAHVSLVNKFVNKKIDMAIFMQSGLQSSRTARVLGER